MRVRNLGWLLAIIVLVGFAVFVDLLPNDPQYVGGDTTAPYTLNILGTTFDWRIKQGLDLQGGTQVLLEAKDPNVTQDQMDGALGVIRQRIDQGLSVNEPVIQQQGSNRILVELPGIKDPDAAIQTFGNTGLLEFVDVGTTPPSVGTSVVTTYPNALTHPDQKATYKVGDPVNAQGTVNPTTPTAGTPGATGTISGTPGATTAAGTPTTATGTATVGTPGATTAATGTATSGTPSASAAAANPAGTPGATVAGTTTAATGTATPAGTTTPAATTTPTSTATYGPQVFQTIMVGSDLDSSKTGVGQNQSTGQNDIEFGIKSGPDAAFLKYTSSNLPDATTGTQHYMAITLDKKIISVAYIKSAISNQGVIDGTFTTAEAQGIVTQLKYGALPIALEVKTTSTVSATLGQDSVSRSIIAGIVGLSIVAAFMLLYYRLPGLLADIALIIYTILSFALYKLLGITLTLAGIAGFILSIGMAVDANVLIFARLKEELRLGRRLTDSIQAGFDHAWPSIRDSNISTMITTFILYWFGDFTGTSVIKGFALTLFLGVVISLFTAVTVTRLLMRVMVSVTNIRNRWWYGMNAAHIVNTPQRATADEREKIGV